MLPSKKAFLNVSENLKLIEYLLFHRHGNCLITRCLSWVSSENIIETAFLQMLIETTIFDWSKRIPFKKKPFSWIIRKFNFRRVKMPNVWEGWMENRAKMKNIGIFLSLDRRFLQVGPDTPEQPPYFSHDQSVFLTQNLAKTWEKSCSQTNFKVFPQLLASPFPN